MNGILDIIDSAIEGNGAMGSDVQITHVDPPPLPTLQPPPAMVPPELVEPPLLCTMDPPQLNPLPPQSVGSTEESFDREGTPLLPNDISDQEKLATLFAGALTASQVEKLCTKPLSSVTNLH